MDPTNKGSKVKLDFIESKNIICNYILLINVINFKDTLV